MKKMIGIFSILIMVLMYGSCFNWPAFANDRDEQVKYGDRDDRDKHRDQNDRDQRRDHEDRDKHRDGRDQHHERGDHDKDRDRHRDHDKDRDKSETIITQETKLVSIDEGKGRRQFITVYPGEVNPPGPYPGYVMTSDKGRLYHPPVYKSIDMDDVRNMKWKFNLFRPSTWKERVRTTILVKKRKLVQENDDPIEMVNYWPKDACYTDDKILASTVVVGEPDWPEELFLGLAYADLKAKTFTKRVAIQTFEVTVGVTDGKSIGVSSAIAQIIAAETGSYAVAAGGQIGKNKAYPEKHIVFEVLAMNDGLTEAPTDAKPPIKSAVKSPTQSAQPQIEIKPINLNVNVNVKHEYPPETPPSRPSTPAPIPSTEEKLQLPDFTVYFELNKYFIKPEYLPLIKKTAQWIKEHPYCQLQVEGHTCVLGSPEYNAVLARNRAKEVYEAFKKEGVSESQLVQFTSLSKDKQASEYLEKNRRVILRMIGQASGK